MVKTEYEDILSILPEQLQKGACYIMTKQLKLPVGIDSFEEIRKSEFYYVDKTRLVEQLLENWGAVNLFTRPRRFGKTLNMSMLKCFFEIGTDRTLFDGLYIAEKQTLCEQYLGKFPVLFISLKGVDGESFEQASYAFTNIVANEARRFAFLLASDKLTEKDKDEYRALIAMREGICTMDEKILVTSLQKLSGLLCKHYDKQAILLIDEYDVPLDKAFQNGYYREMVTLLRGIFGNALKSNPFLKFAVLTGCLRVSKESIFTGMNNFKVLSITDPRFDEQFGFTEDEVSQLLAAYHLEEHLPEIKEWYDGYRFGDADVYCPWDVINYVDLLRYDAQAKPQAYWINTSSNALVKRFVDKADKSTRDELERLVAGEQIEKHLRLDLTYDEIDNNIENLWSVLFTTGYLTQAGMTEDGAYKLVIPNAEVREVYKLQIQDWFKRTVFANTEQLELFWQALAKGAAKAAERYLNKTLSNTISLFDIKGQAKDRENSYHLFLAGLLIGNAEWLVRSNREAGDGFADIIVETDDPDAGLVIELKSVSGITELDGACAKALQQIHERHYDEYLRDEGREDIWAYGIAFYKKRCRVMAERI